ncbi:MAG TPA: gluconokinase [Gaiellaceae bacterium]|nr:gluconokinase [Gaiellaceae bacterium]
MTAILAVDVGTSSVRAAVDRHEEVQTPYQLGAREVGAEELAETCLEAMRRAGDADAVAISCFWHSLVALDEDGKPLTPVLTWSDVGSAHSVPVDAFERTGCPPHASYWPAKLARLRDEQPEVFERAAVFAGFGDYLGLRLTGELRTSLSMASGTGLLNLGTRGWDAEVLEALGLTGERLPPISDEPVGGVYPALGDGACSNVGAGCVTAGRAALMIGTSGAFRVVREDDGSPPRRGLFRYLLDRRRVVEGGSLSDGGNLYAWLKRTLREVDTRGLAERPPSELTFLPLLGGERAPGWNAEARGAIAGLSFGTAPLDLVQAALEGVAFRFAEIADLMPEVEEVVVTGRALLADPDWQQILADVLGRPLQVSAVREASLRGAAAIVHERLGGEVEPAPLAGVISPRRERAESYRVARERQRHLYEGVT